MPDAHLLFSGEYARAGRDLIISDEHHRFTVPNYFAGTKHPALVSPEGAPLDPKVIEAYTGHTAYAQATDPAASAGKVVGHVVKMTGSASIVRNGVAIVVNNGDVIYQNDLVQTGSNSTLGLVLEDGTAFNLSANSRFMLNELTYDASSTSNSALLTLVQGAASFVAGQVAKSGDMKVATPVATMGIRGTAVILDINSTDGKVSISVVDQQDGQVHAVQVFNAAGVLIGTVTSNGNSLTLTPTATFDVIAQESNKTPAQVAQEFAAFQQVLNTYDVGKQIFPNLPQHTENTGGNGNNPSPNTTTKFAGSPPLNPPGTEYHPPTGSTTTQNASSGTPTQVVINNTPPASGGTSGSTTTPADPVIIQTKVVSAIPFVVTPPALSPITSGAGDHFGPVMSASGDVVYDPDGAIYFYDHVTQTTLTVASPANGWTYGSPTISMDSRYIVYQGSQGGGSSYVFVYGTDPTDAAHYHTPTLIAQGGSAAVSGDGSTIVVEQGGGNIAIYDLQGTLKGTITPQAVGGGVTLWRPAISADGHVITFWSSDSGAPGGAGHLYVFNASTGTLTEIASTSGGAGTSAASVSADGHLIAYAATDASGHSEVYLFDLNTGHVVFHTANASGGSYYPVLSPDGHFIAFTSDAHVTSADNNAFADIYVVDVTNPAAPQYKLVSEGNAAASNGGVAISAGGQYVAFGSASQIFFADPTSGKSAIILETVNSPDVLTAHGTITLTGDFTGVGMSITDKFGNPTPNFSATFDAAGHINWTFSEAKSDFAGLAYGEDATQEFIIKLSADNGTLTIPVFVTVHDGVQPTITPTDAAPIAHPVTLAQSDENTPTTITAGKLLAGVTDIDGPFPLVITALSIASGGGSLVHNDDRTWTYTPAENYSGPVSFNYTASDGTLSASSTASLNISAVDQPPVAGPVTLAQGAEDTPYTISASDLLAGVNDPDGPFPLSITALSIASGGGALVDNHDGTWTYTPAANYNGPVSFNYTAADGTLVSSATASLNLAPVNDAPTIAGGSVVAGTVDVPVTSGGSGSHTAGADLILNAGSGLISGLNGHSGYGTLALSAGDDNSSGAIDITSVFGSAGINFFGHSYTSLYVNNNGNITFNGPNSTFTPSQINAGFGNPIIAPFWADVDTRGAGHVYYDLDPVDGVMTITWDHVGYYSAHTDRLNSFQVVLVNEGGGNFDIVYRYGGIQWTTGDVSGGQAARAGYSAGDGTHYFELPASGNVSALLALPTTEGNTHVNGVDEFDVRNGEVGPPSLTTNGTINFSDIEPNDVHSIQSVTYTGAGDALGTLHFTKVTDTSESGTGQFAWTYTTDRVAVRAALDALPEHTKTETFDVVITDGDKTVTQTITVTLNETGDHAPVASAVTLAAGTEDTAYTVHASALLAGVSDVDGPFPLSITALSVTSGGGNLVPNDDGSWTYTPATNYNGPVSFSYTASDGTLTSSSTASLTLAPVNDLPTGAVSIDGTFQAPHVLTANTSTLADADGLGTLAYQWQRDGVDIALQTGNSYTLTGADVGHSIDVVVHYTDGQGNAESVTSAGSPPIAPAPPDAPPSISGDFAVLTVKGGGVALRGLAAGTSTADLIGIDADNTPEQLLYTVTGALHGHLAYSLTGPAITSFTQAEVNARSVFFVTDDPTYVGAGDFTATLSDGTITTAPATIGVTIVDAQLSVQTVGGFDFDQDNPITAMGLGTIADGASDTVFKIENEGANRDFTFTGTGFTYAGTGSEMHLTGGIITAIVETGHGTPPQPAFSRFDLYVPAVEWMNAVSAAAHGDQSVIETLTRTWSFNFIGNAGADGFGASILNDIFTGNSGDDTFEGEFGYDRAYYGNAGAAINVQLADGFVVGASTGTDTLKSIEMVTGSDYADLYNAGPTPNNPDGFGAASTNSGSTVTSNTFGLFNEFEGRGGDDQIFGNGQTRLSYYHATAGVTVTFTGWTNPASGSTGFADGDASVGHDTFSSVNWARGSFFDDVFHGANNPSGSTENFEGLGGNDLIDGGGGFDRAVYQGAFDGTGINVQLAKGIVTGGPTTGTDTLLSVEAIRGTDFADVYDASGFTTIATADNPNAGSAGFITVNDTARAFNEFEGQAGNDTVTGNGNTRVAYYHATAGVVVTLGVNGSGTADGDASVGHDTIISGVRSITGSEFNDVLTGNGGNNVLDGRGGNDVLDGRASNDTLTGGTGADIFVYSAGGGADRITDLNPGDGDRIDLRGVPGVYSLADVLALVSTNGPDTVITFSPGNSITLANTALANLVASEFMFAGAPMSVAVTVQTPDGYDFSTVATDLVASAIATSASTSEHIFLVDAAKGITFEMVGSGFTYDSITHHVTGGLVTEIDILDSADPAQTTQDQILANSNGWSIDAATLFNTLDQAQSADAQTSAAGKAALTSYLTSPMFSYVGSPGGQDHDGRPQLGADVFVAGNHADTFNGMAGPFGPNDPGSDTVSYATAGAGVTASLLNPADNTGAAAGDIYVSIENLRGSSFDDVLTGDGKNNVLEGGAGHNILDGGSRGIDTASYEHAPTAVNVNLNLTGIQLVAPGMFDQFLNIEGLRGSSYDDTLTGNGNGILEGGPGDDNLIGNPGGSDTASYEHAPSGVTVDLAISGPQNTGGAGIDKLANIANLMGSQFNDILAGDSHDNILTGNGGNDIFVFRELPGGIGHDTIQDFITDTDHIQLDYAAFDAGDPASFAAWLSDHATQQSNGDLLIDLNVNGPDVDTILLKNTSINSLRANDFILPAGGGGGFA